MPLPLPPKKWRPATKPAVVAEDAAEAVAVLAERTKRREVSRSMPRQRLKAS